MYLFWPMEGRKFEMKRIIAGIICFIIGASLIGGSIYWQKNGREPQSEKYSDFIQNSDDGEGKYVSIKAVDYIQFLTAVDNSTENYYFVQDEDGIFYIVRISSGDTEEMDKAFEEGESYELKGTLHSIDSDLKNNVINTMKEVAPGSEISEENYANYFPNSYMSYKERSDRITTTVIGLSGVLFIIVALVFAWTWIIPRAKVTKK